MIIPLHSSRRNENFTSMTCNSYANFEQRFITLIHSYDESFACDRSIASSSHEQLFIFIILKFCDRKFHNVNSEWRDPWESLTRWIILVQLCLLLYKIAANIVAAVKFRIARYPSRPKKKKKKIKNKSTKVDTSFCLDFRVRSYVRLYTPEV